MCREVRLVFLLCIIVISGCSVRSNEENVKYSMYIRAESGSRDYFKASWTIDDSHPILSITRHKSYICNFCHDIDFTVEMEFLQKHRRHLSEVRNVTETDFARVSYSCVFSNIAYCTVFHFTSSGTFSYDPMRGANLNSFNVSEYVKGPNYNIFIEQFEEMNKRWILILKRMTELNQPKYITANLCVSDTQPRTVRCTVHSPSKAFLTAILVTGGYFSKSSWFGRAVSSGVLSDISADYSLPMYCLVFSRSTWMTTLYYRDYENCTNRTLSSIDLEIYPVPYYTMIEKTKIIRQRYKVPEVNKPVIHKNVNRNIYSLANNLSAYIMGLTAFCVLCTPILVGVILLRKCQNTFNKTA